MDFLAVGRHVMSSIHTGNSTDEMVFTRLPASLLETFIPGYGLVAHFISRWAGFDIGLLVTAVVVLVGLGKTYTWLWSHVWAAFNKLFMSKVYIEDHDDLFAIFMRYMAAKRLSDSSRAMKVKTPYGSTWNDDNGDDKRPATDALDENGLFNYRKLQARMPPRYEPYYGHQSFWHKGRWFQVLRSKKTSRRHFYDQEEDLLELSCIGWSIKPIKLLLEDIKAWSMRKSLDSTRIRRATTKSSRRGVGWSIVQSRPSRPMSTVILDDQYKEVIVSDMNEFLHPNSPKWYATRGIPYRRGYLFHGPPGTGKTSLSFALAGIFGLDLFCLALNDPELTESDVLDLFNGLPDRCIVLLEDIDEAGLKRPDHEMEEGKGKLAIDASKDGGDDKESGTVPSTGVDPSKDTPAAAVTTDRLKLATARPEPIITAPPSPTTATAPDSRATPPMQSDADRAIANLATALATALSTAQTKVEQDIPSKAPSRGRKRGSARKGRGDGMPPGPGSSSSDDGGISLSGLLNAIDGVATHEGRVLIMTTNHPEMLDEALVRTGRVDVSVKFDFASQLQIQELFLRMYGANLDGEGPPAPFAEGGGLELWEAQDGANQDGETKQKHNEEGEKQVAAARLEELATLFAGRLPDRSFSPSDVQGYLLLHKKSPLQAVNKVEAWRDEELKRKQEKLDKTAAGSTASAAAAAYAPDTASKTS